MTTEFENKVWEAFWRDGNNKDGLERVVAVVFAEAARIATEAAEDAPEASYNDSGATGDGWRMACREIAERIFKADMTETAKTTPAFPTMRGEVGGIDGMSLRDWFASQALAGMLSNGATITVADPALTPQRVMANAAYTLADAMLMARA